MRKFYKFNSQIQILINTGCQNMSINKLKLGSKKKQVRPLLSKQQKLKQLNGQIIDSLNKQHIKSNQKKLSFINIMANEIDSGIINISKAHTLQGSQTERKRLERADHQNSLSKMLNKRSFEEQVSQFQDNQQNTSASQLLDGLNLQIQYQKALHLQGNRSWKKPFMKSVSTNQKGVTIQKVQTQKELNESKQQRQSKSGKEIEQKTGTNPLFSSTVRYSIQDITKKSNIFETPVKSTISNKSLTETQEVVRIENNTSEIKEVKAKQAKQQTIDDQSKNVKENAVIKTQSIKVQQPVKVPLQISNFTIAVTSLTKSNNEDCQQVNAVKNKISYNPINEVELLILEQNKLLSQQVQILRKQRDNLLFSTKRLEVQLLQTNNKDYYERQNSRLRKEVEQLQQSNEQFKHNNFVLQNKNKQLESTQEVNQKQIKRIIKQLEQSKLQSTKQKYENKQKSKTLQSLIKQLEQKNSELSTKFEDYYGRFQEQEKIVKIKNQQELKLKKELYSYQAKLNSLEKLQNQKKKHYEEQFQRYTKQNSQLSINYRNFRRQSESQIDNLKQNIKQLNLKRDSQVLLLQSRTKFLQKHNNTIQAQLQVVRLEQIVRQLKDQVDKRSNLIKQLNSKIDQMISMKDYEQLRKEYEGLNQSKLAIMKNYETKILNLTEKINYLTEQIKQNKSQQSLSQQLEGKGANFKQILKQQIQQCDNLKQQIFKKNQIIFQNKQQLEQVNLAYSTLKNQNDILRKQHHSFQNNSKVKKQILEQELVNEIESYKRKLQVLDKKYQSKIKENKEKQSFITNYIVGKSSQNVDANYLLKELQRVFLEKEKNALLSN